METSAFVEVFTAVLPFILLAIIFYSLIVYTIKIAKHHQAEGKIAEQQWKRMETEIEEIKHRIDRIEKDHN